MIIFYKDRFRSINLPARSSPEFQCVAYEIWFPKLRCGKYAQTWIAAQWNLVIMKSFWTEGYPSFLYEFFPVSRVWQAFGSRDMWANLPNVHFRVLGGPGCCKRLLEIFSRFKSSIFLKPWFFLTKQFLNKTVGKKWNLRLILFNIKTKKPKCQTHFYTIKAQTFKPHSSNSRHDKIA